MNYRFSGHETFACRYAWLPKAAQAVNEDRTILTSSREQDAMVELGVGKNMVRSIRFWAEAAQIIESSEKGHAVTPFGKSIFGFSAKPGFDPYLEDIQTLWLIHWKISTNFNFLIFAWDFLLNRYNEPELTISTGLTALKKAAAASSNKSISESSLSNLLNVFLHTYLPTRGKKGQVKEDNLDSPLVELNLLKEIKYSGKKIGAGRTEVKYAFRREEKPEVSPYLFAYCLDDFWTTRHGDRDFLPFDLITIGEGSPGQVYKIPEHYIRTRMLSIERETEGYFRFDESADIPVLRRSEKNQLDLLAKVYTMEPAYA